MNVMKTKNIKGCMPVGTKQYYLSTGTSRLVPIYEVFTYAGFNQLIGYVQYKYKKEKILYRGQCVLHNNSIPSIYRGRKIQSSQTTARNRLQRIIKKILNDKKFKKTFGAHNHKFSQDENEMIEALLQHYGVATRYIDVVDNHWIALWFGHYIYEINKNGYARYVKRSEDLFQYIILFAIPMEDENRFYANTCANAREKVCAGVYKTKEVLVIDLRRACPSTFLRPHAQHGWLIRKNKDELVDKDGLNKHIVGIIKINVGKVESWLGNGCLLSAQNLFPSPIDDEGYNIFLKRSDLFDDKIVKYVY